MKRLGIARTLFELALIAAVVVLAIHRPTPQKNSLICSVPTRQKVVALTFDDGPNPVFTPQILDILDKYHARATFFMIGKNMDAHPEIVRDVLRRGHAIGNHTYTHPRDLDQDTQAQMIRELDRCEQVIERLSGKRAHLFRPPRGLIDGAGLTIAEEEGYRTVLWSACADHHDAPTPQLMAERVIRRNRPGAIILIHDGGPAYRWKDVAATSLIVEALSKQGYRFITVPELLNMK